MGPPSILNSTRREQAPKPRTTKPNSGHAKPRGISIAIQSFYITPIHNRTSRTDKVAPEKRPPKSQAAHPSYNY
jgi:hypothetical protein